MAEQHKNTKPHKIDSKTRTRKEEVSLQKIWDWLVLNRALKSHNAVLRDTPPHTPVCTLTTVLLRARATPRRNENKTKTCASTAKKAPVANKAQSIPMEARSKEQYSAHRLVQDVVAHRFIFRDFPLKLLSCCNEPHQQKLSWDTHTTNATALIFA